MESKKIDITISLSEEHVDFLLEEIGERRKLNPQRNVTVSDLAEEIITDFLGLYGRRVTRKSGASVWSKAH